MIDYYRLRGWALVPVYVVMPQHAQVMKDYLTLAPALDSTKSIGRLFHCEGGARFGD